LFADPPVITRAAAPANETPEEMFHRLFPA
jgi:hypothetical protein